MSLTSRPASRKTISSSSVIGVGTYTARFVAVSGNLAKNVAARRSAPVMDEVWIDEICALAHHLDALTHQMLLVCRRVPAVSESGAMIQERLIALDRQCFLREYILVAQLLLDVSNRGRDEYSARVLAEPRKTEIELLGKSVGIEGFSDRCRTAGISTSEGY